MTIVARSPNCDRRCAGVCHASKRAPLIGLPTHLSFNIETPRITPNSMIRNSSTRKESLNLMSPDKGDDLCWRLESRRGSFFLVLTLTGTSMRCGPPSINQDDDGSAILRRVSSRPLLPATAICVSPHPLYYCTPGDIIQNIMVQILQGPMAFPTTTAACLSVFCSGVSSLDISSQYQLVITFSGGRLKCILRPSQILTWHRGNIVAI